MRFLSVLTLLLPLGCLVAQTCCSGGVPLAGNLGLPAAGAGNWQIGLSYDHNRLRRLYTGSESFRSTSRTRTTHTALLELGYTFNDRWRLDFLLPYVVQERRIERSGTTLDRTDGLGDAVILLRYNWLATDGIRPWQWASGVGGKLPNGAADRRNPDDITYNADLQPGSRAWDLILWNRVGHQLASRPSLSVFLTSVYRFRGTNDNYLPLVDSVTGEERPQSYRFGNELQLTAGVSDRVPALGTLFDPGLSLRFRHAGPDRTNGVVTPSTGGAFLFLQPSVGVAFGPRLIGQVAADLPLYVNVTGTQLAPTFRLNLGFIWLLPKQSDL